MTADVDARPVCIDGEYADVEEWPAINPWVPALLLYTTPIALIAVAAFIAAR